MLLRLELGMVTARDWGVAKCDPELMSLEMS